MSLIFSQCDYWNVENKNRNRKIDIAVQNYPSVCVCVCAHSVTQLCLTLCNPMDCSQLDSPSHGIFNGSPVQVWCMGQNAQGWCTGMTQRDGMGREVGWGFRMGNTCTPVADSCQCRAKPLQYYKLTSLQLKWINLYKK